MVKKTIARFEIQYLQVLSQAGKLDKSLSPKLSTKQIKEFYEWMVLIRAFDTKAISLQRQGRIGTYASFLGQEASQVGSALALEDSDWMVPSYRESGALVVRGHPMKGVYQYWGGDVRGNYANVPPYNLPIAIPVGSQTLHAAGIAMALSLQKKKAAALCYFGDGATSKGDFHEAANFAGVFRAPVIFLCQNNQFAISVRRRHQTASQTIAQKAIAYGIEGIQVDGNDVIAVYKATMDALKRAKNGEGPTLIESFTYRMSDHTTSDDAKRYRTDKEVTEWREKDPIQRLKKYMQSQKIWTESYQESVEKKAKEQVEAAVVEFEKTTPPAPEDIFQFTYAKVSPTMERHRETMLRSL